jgi:hypothetical protein
VLAFEPQVRERGQHRNEVRMIHAECALLE